MECICVIKDIYRAINSFEDNFLKTYDLCINEALVLCSLQNKQLSSSEIAEQAGLKFSHASKIIKSIEEKGLIMRTIGHSDKRYMNFELSPWGKDILEKIEKSPVEIPELLLPIFNCKNQQAPIW
jgi:DNA-binding MarR family transcriptional regulator